MLGSFADFFIKISTSMSHTSPISVLDLFILKKPPILKQQMTSPHNCILFCVYKLFVVLFISGTQRDELHQSS